MPGTDGRKLELNFIQKNQLDTISENCNGDSILCYAKVFTVWEKKDPTDFTWGRIVEVLKSLIVEENKLARDIVECLSR